VGRDEAGSGNLAGSDESLTAVVNHGAGRSVLAIFTVVDAKTPRTGNTDLSVLRVILRARLAQNPIVWLLKTKSPLSERSVPLAGPDQS
jgi:hypothetical protein